MTKIRSDGRTQRNLCLSFSFIYFIICDAIKINPNIWTCFVCIHNLLLVDFWGIKLFWWKSFFTWHPLLIADALHAVGCEILIDKHLSNEMMWCAVYGLEHVGVIQNFLSYLIFLNKKKICMWESYWCRIRKKHSKKQSKMCYA